MPANRQITMIKNHGRLRVVAILAAIQPLSARMDPIDKSKPADPITKLAAIASKPITVVAKRMFSRLSHVKNKGVSAENKTTSAISTPYVLKFNIGVLLSDIVKKRFFLLTQNIFV